MEPITKDNLRKVDIKFIALNKDKFGALTFNISYPVLDKLQKFFVDLEDFGYKDVLTQNEVNNIESYKTNFANYLQRLANFDPENNPNFNKNIRDGFENEVKNFYDSTFNALRNIYVFLRQEADIKSRNGKDIQRETLNTKKESEKILNELKKELEQIKSKKTEYEVVHGQEAAVKFSRYFSEQAVGYHNQSRKWLITQIVFFSIILLIVIFNIALYFWLIYHNENISTVFTLQYGIAKLVLLSILSYAVGFSSKNYHIYAQQESVNLHRKNAADTMNDLITANPDKADVRAEVISQAAEAMFKHMPVGHITKSENSAGPILEIVDKVFKKS